MSVRLLRMLPPSSSLSEGHYQHGPKLRERDQSPCVALEVRGLARLAVNLLGSYFPSRMHKKRVKSNQTLDCNRPGLMDYRHREGFQLFRSIQRLVLKSCLGGSHTQMQQRSSRLKFRQNWAYASVSQQMFGKSQKDTLANFSYGKYASPGPSYYHNNTSSFQPPPKIVTGSLSGPKELCNDLGSFGTTQRFAKPAEVTPGPADYQNTSSKQPAHAKPARPRMVSGMIPLVPFTSESWMTRKLEETPHKCYEQLRDPHSTSVLKRTVPSYSFPKCAYPSRQGPPEKPPQLCPEQPVVMGWSRRGSENGPIYECQCQHEQTQLHAQPQLHEYTHELELARARKEQRKQELLEVVLNSAAKPSLEVLQLRKNFQEAQLPGPGFYNVNLDTLQVRDRYNAQAAFASNVDRFAGKSDLSEPGPGAYTRAYTRTATCQKAIGFTFGREPRMEVPDKECPPYCLQPLSKRETVRPSYEPFGSGAVRFQREREQPVAEPSKRRSKSLRRIKKSSVATCETMESSGSVVNLQSVQALLHMYANV